MSAHFIERNASGSLLLVASAMLAALALIDSASAQNIPSSNAVKWGSHIDIEGKWGNRRTLGDIGLFAPLWQNSNSLFFTDIRARYDNDDGREGNFGLGWRHMLANGWNAGAYAFYDARRSPSGNLFQQATLGAELLHHDYDARVNFYIPFSNREYVLGGGGGGGAPFADIQGGNLVIVTPGGQLVERSLRGADFEAGYRLPVFPWNSTVQLRAYAGAYWFDGENLIRDIAGPRGRLELSWDNLPYLNEGSRFTLGVEAQHDDVRGSNNFINARLRIPLSPVQTAYSRLSPQERRMTERVVRDVDIVSASASKGGPGAQTTEAAINEYNGVQVASVQQVDSSTATIVDLRDTVLGSATGSIVIANGTFNSPGFPVTVGAGNTLIGGGTVLPLRGATSGVQVNFTAPGAAGSINANIAGGAAVYLSSNSVVGGMTITNSSAAVVSRGVHADNVSGVTIFGNTINTNANLDYGILIGNVTNGKILNNQINALGDDARAISIGGSPGMIVDGNTMTARYVGIEISFSDNAVLNGNNIQSQFGFGISSETNNNLTISNNSFGPVILNTQIFVRDTAINSPASTGNVDNTSPAATRCQDNFFAPSSGTIGYTTGANCTFP